MKTLIKYSLLILLSASNLVAEPLASKKIDSFISTLLPLRKLAQASPSEEIRRAFMSNFWQDGINNGVYSTMLKTVAAVDQEHKLIPQVEEIATASGFSSKEEWAQTGDRVISAFIAFKLLEQKAELSKILQLSEAEIEKLPTPFRERTIKLRELAEAVLLVPEEDRRAIVPFIKKLQALDTTAK